MRGERSGDSFVFVPFAVGPWHSQVLLSLERRGPCQRVDPLACNASRGVTVKLCTVLRNAPGL